MQDGAILILDPGTPSTQLGLCAPDRPKLIPVVEQTIGHDEAVMARFAGTADQRPHRAAVPANVLANMPGGVRLAAVAPCGEW